MEPSTYKYIGAGLAIGRPVVVLIGGAAESEEEVNVSIGSGRGRQAYPAARRPASDEKKRAY